MSKIYEALELEQSKHARLNESSQEDHTPGQTREIEKRKVDHPVLWRNANPEVEEEFINLYYSIHSMLGQKAGKVVQFVGSAEVDGTSTVVEHFGRVSTSELGKSVLLLKAEKNGNSSGIHAEEPNAHTLERLGNGASPDEIFLNDGEPCFFVWSLTNPASKQMVRSPERFQTVLSKLRDHFDLILVDMPAPSSSPLGIALSAVADGVILVVEAERTKISAAEKAKQRIQRAGGNVLGVVLNKHRSHIPEAIAQL